MASWKIDIEYESEYYAMKRIDALMRKGDQNLTEQEAEEIATLAIAAQYYEKRVYCTLIQK